MVPNLSFVSIFRHYPAVAACSETDNHPRPATLPFRQTHPVASHWLGSCAGYLCGLRYGRPTGFAPVTASRPVIWILRVQFLELQFGEEACLCSSFQPHSQVYDASNHTSLGQPERSGSDWVCAPVRAVAKCTGTNGHRNDVAPERGLEFLCLVDQRRTTGGIHPVRRFPSRVLDGDRNVVHVTPSHGWDPLLRKRNQRHTSGWLHGDRGRSARSPLEWDTGVAD